MTSSHRIARGARHLADPTATTLAFGASLPPQLPPDTYSIQVTQTVTGGGGGANPIAETYTQSQAIAVASPRFVLPANAVITLSPAAGASGDFTGVLPAIVLASPTAPWTNPGDSTDPSVLRLGIVLIGDNDLSTGQPLPTPAPAPSPTPDPTPPPTPNPIPAPPPAAPVLVSMTLSDAIIPSDPTTYFPATTLQPGEDGTQTVAVLDLPAALFLSCAPAASDLPFAAHVRQVDPPSGPVYAVVIGTRLPYVTQRYTAYLVSLDGYAPALSQDGGATLPPVATPAPKTYRLIVLESWSFTSTAEKVAFEQTAKALNSGGNPAALQWQVPSGTPADPAAAPWSPSNLLAIGHCPIPHVLRDGSTTVSLYRGPLAPMPVLADASVAAMLVIDTQDAVLRYDPASGLFDASLSAAWQVGQMLAASNGAVLAAQYQLQQAHINAVALNTNRTVMVERLGALEPHPRGALSVGLKRLSVEAVARIAARRKETQR